MNLSMKHKRTHGEQTCGGGAEGFYQEFGISKQMQTITHRMDKQQGHVVQNREPQSVVYNQP